MKRKLTLLPLPIIFGLGFLVRMTLLNEHDQDVRNHVQRVIEDPQYASSHISTAGFEDTRSFTRDLKGSWSETSDGINYYVHFNEDRNFTYKISIDGVNKGTVEGKWSHVGKSTIVYLNHLEGASHIVSPKLQILDASFSRLVLHAPPVGVLDLSRKK